MNVDLLNHNQWQKLDAWPAAARPAAQLWRLLSERGSLTDRLREQCPDGFGVRPREQRVEAAGPETARLLAVAPGSPVDSRRVTLDCGTSPRVYAHSLAPEGYLASLGEEPLGDRLFPQGSARRGPIEVALLAAGAPLFDAAVAGCGITADALWARRSVIEADGVRYLVQECFLEGVA